MKFLEGHLGQFRETTREEILSMDRAELEEFLEFRCVGIFKSDSTETIRKIALKEYDNAED